jgi:ferredoxin
MHVEVDRDICEGYGVCAQSAPEVFALDENGESVVLRSEVGAALAARTRLAETSCPMRAVRIS